MPTYSEKRMREIIDAFEVVGVSINVLERAIVAADGDEYNRGGKEFIMNMAFCHKRMKETHVIYSADVAEAKAAMNPKIEKYAMRPGLEVAGANWSEMADENGIIRGAE